MWSTAACARSVLQDTISMLTPSHRGAARTEIEYDLFAQWFALLWTASEKV